MLYVEVNDRLGRTSAFRGESGKVWDRRYLALAVRSGEGPCTYPLRTETVQSLPTVTRRPRATR